MTNESATFVVMGCYHCGTDSRGHAQRWIASAGWHGWTQPTKKQIEMRMRVNRGMGVE